MNFSRRKSTKPNLTLLSRESLPESTNSALRRSQPKLSMVDFSSELEEDTWALKISSNNMLRVSLSNLMLLRAWIVVSMATRIEWAWMTLRNSKLTFRLKLLQGEVKSRLTLVHHKIRPKKKVQLHPLMLLILITMRMSGSKCKSHRWMHLVSSRNQNITSHTSSTGTRMMTNWSFRQSACSRIKQ